MKLLRKLFPAGWQPIIALLLLAVCVIYVGYTLDEEDRSEARRPSPNQPSLVSPDLKGKATRSSLGPALLGANRDPSAEATTKPSTDVAPVRAQFGRAVNVLSGRILDTGGQPIHGARVTLGERKALSDAAGEFLLPAGSDDLVVKHRDYFHRRLSSAQRHDLSRATTTETNGNGSLSSRIIVVLFPGGRVRGVVRTVEGVAVEGVEVRFATQEPGGRTALTALRTDASGHYESPLRHPGTHHVFFRHNSYQSLDMTVTVPTGGQAATLDATLRAGKKLRINVTAADARGLPDAQVWLIERDRKRQIDESRYLGTTDDSGNLETRWNPGHPHRVRVVLPGYRATERRAHGDVVSIPLAPAPMLRGTAIDKRSGLPVVPSEIQLEVSADSDFERAPDRGTLFAPLEPGRFHVGLPPFAGRYRVLVRSAGHLEGYSSPIEFDGKSNPVDVSVHLSSRGGLQGLVLFEDSPLPEITIELYRNDSSRWGFTFGVPISHQPTPAATQTTDAAGKFTFSEVRPGVYLMRVLKDGFAEVVTGPLTVPAPAPVPLTLLRGVTLSGTVLNANDSPESEIPLILVSKGRPFPRFAVSDAEGNYRFANLSDGDYILLLGDPYATETAPVAFHLHRPDAVPLESHHRYTVSIRNGKDTVYDVNMHNLGWGSLVGRVKENGEALSNVRLAVSGPREQPTPEQPAGGLEIRTDSTGVFRLHGLLPGTYEVRSETPPFVRSVAVSTGTKSELDVLLQKVRLSLQLVDAKTTQPFRGQAVAQVLSSLTNAEISRLPATGGKATFFLYPGVYRARARAKGYLPAEVEFEIAKPKSATVSAEGPGTTEIPPQLLTLTLRPGIRVRVAVLRKTLDASGTENAAEVPIRGLTQLVLLRDEVEIHRYYGVIDGEVLLPELEPGVYTMTIEDEQGRARTRFEVSDPETGESSTDTDTEHRVRVELR